VATRNRNLGMGNEKSREENTEGGTRNGFVGRR